MGSTSARHSAGLLAYRVAEDGMQVFLAHMGGPFWAGRDDGGWSVPKGEYDPEAESPWDVARREFAEEIGVEPPVGEVLDLGVCRQPSGKRVRTFAVHTTERVAFVASNTFVTQWPRGSGHVLEFPEVDRAEWFSTEEARRKVVSGQVPIIDALQAALTGTGSNVDSA